MSSSTKVSLRSMAAANGKLSDVESSRAISSRLASTGTRMSAFTERSHRANAGRAAALGASVLVARRGRGQIDLEQVRERCQPREHVGELELEVGPLARADRPRELP